MLHKYTKGVTMSEFRVKLNNAKQGLLDLDPTSASSLQFSVSKQRTMFVVCLDQRLDDVHFKCWLESPFFTFHVLTIL